MLRLRRNPVRDFLHVAGDVGELDTEAADPAAELVDQPFALRSFGGHFRCIRLRSRHRYAPTDSGSLTLWSAPQIRQCALKLIGGAEAAPVPAPDADRHIDLAHHDGVAVPHIAGIALDQVGALVAAGGKPGGVVEDA